jgi:hypothetical protein
MSAQIHPRPIPFEKPPRIRAMLTLGVASEVLALAPASTEPGTFTLRMQLREQTQEFEAWYATMVAGNAGEVLAAMAAGNTVLGIAAPPFADPLAIRRLFSLDGQDIICSAAAPDDFVTSICRAIELRKDQLGVPPAVACGDWLRAHDNAVPLHAAAAAFWFGE